MDKSFDYTAVDSIIDGFGAYPRSVIAILQGVQEHYRYLPKEVFPYLAKR